MIILIDFDDTIVKEEYPNIGRPFLLAPDVIRGWYEDGNQILINTCRAGRFEGQAVDFLLEHSIPFDYVNCNIPSIIERYKMDCRKLSGDLNIDDKNLGGLPKNENGGVDWITLDMQVRAHPKYKGATTIQRCKVPCGG